MKKSIKYGVAIFVVLAILGSAMNKVNEKKESVEKTEETTIETTTEMETTEEETTDVETTEEITTNETTEETTTEEATTEKVTTTEEKTEIHTSSYVLNTNTMKAHVPSCSSVNKIKEGNRKDVESDPETLKKQGYSPCGNCRPW